MSAAPPSSLTTRYLQKSPVFLSVYYWPPKKLHLHYNHNMLHSLFARRATFPPEGHTFQTGPTQTIIIIMIMIIIIIIIVTTTTPSSSPEGNPVQAVPSQFEANPLSQAQSCHLVQPLAKYFDKSKK